MTWEQFLQVGATIVYWTFLWLLLSVPAALILFAFGRFFPNQPGEAAGRGARSDRHSHGPVRSD